jgi:disulfide bond formation protein DsbB
LLQIVLVSMIVIAGFYYFQAVVGLVPCELCLRERGPWYFGLVMALVFLVWAPTSLQPWLPAFFVVVFLVSAALGVHHVLVEQHLIVGPTACAATSGAGASLEELKRQLLATKPVRCDEVQWRFAGISLAGWNVVASLLVVAIAAAQARPRSRGRRA